MKIAMIALVLVFTVCMTLRTLHAQALPTMNYEGYAAFLEENRGKVVVVDFWATWCGPCRKKLPELQKCRGFFPEEELTMIGISLDFNPETLQAYLVENPLNYPVYWADEELRDKLEIQSIPLLHIYDMQGRLQIEEEGLTPHETLCQNMGLFADRP